MADEQLLAAAPLSPSIINDPAVTPASCASCQCLPCDYCDEAACGQPINWTAGPYLKVGVPFVLGSSLLENDQDSGWMVEGGIRQPIARDIAGDKLFFDLGGSHMSAFGETKRTSGGVVTNILIDNDPGMLDPDAFITTLKELQRSTVHAALGYYWGSPIDNRAGGWDVRLATRFGGRVGSMRGRFDEFLDPALASNPLNNVALVPHAKTDLTGGLFFSIEAVVLQRAYRYGTIQWTLDSEYANDWVQLQGFDKGSLGTASVLFGMMFSR